MVLELLRQAPPEGRVDLDGDRVFALVSTYETQPADCAWRFEGHREYIDIQYVASGSEIIGWAPSERAAVTVPYDRAADIWFGTVPPAEITALPMPAGRVAVLFPSDAHCPGRAWGAPEQVKKIVVKIALASLWREGHQS